ncbi:MAG: 50S ribosomal protein L17 [Phycisphaerae bacterium]
MRHRLAGRILNRTPSHRLAMRRNMARSLFQHGAIRTTEAKAKELRRFVEKLITVARKGTLHARRQVLRELGDRPMFDEEGIELEQTVVQKLFDEIAPRYVNRPGGYTRIIRLADRRIGDAGTQVIIQLVEEESTGQGSSSGGASRRRKRAAKRRAAAKGVTAKEAPAEEEEAEAPETSAEESAEAPSEEAAEESSQEQGGEEEEKKEE